MKKKNHGHTNHERYLVTYSDLITLLLAFFIILYSMSSPDEAKVESLSNQLSIAFHASTDSMIPSTMVSKEMSERKRGEQASDSERQTMSSVSEQNELREVKEKIEEEAKNNGLSEDVKAELTDAGLKVILTDKILFESGSAILNNSLSINLIDQISLILSSIDNPVSIDGHTDNVPINNSVYTSNWELSSSRSLSVLKEMIDYTPKLDPTRFSATGYGEYKPLSNNDSVSGRELNRRVEILVKRQHQEGLLKPEERGEEN